MQKRLFNLFLHYFFARTGAETGKGVIMVRTLTLEDRRKIERMWRGNASPVKIAAELEISQCTVYKELKRGQETSKAGDGAGREFPACVQRRARTDRVSEEFAEIL